MRTSSAVKGVEAMLAGATLKGFHGQQEVFKASPARAGRGCGIATRAQKADVQRAELQIGMVSQELVLQPCAERGRSRWNKCNGRRAGNFGESLSD
jgi:hypothetical protein